MDDDRQYLGNTPGTDGRGQLHTKAFGAGSLLSGVEYDEIDASYPDSVTEVYVYKLATVTQATVTVVYTDSSKNYIVSAIRT